MNLYKVYNGYTGDSAVHVIVIAEDEEEAIKLATETFKQEAGTLYPESYWTNLDVELLSEDTAIAFCSEVSE